jgi:hypothetical protein
MSTTTQCHPSSTHTQRYVRRMFGRQCVERNDEVCCDMLSCYTCALSITTQCHPPSIHTQMYVHLQERQPGCRFFSCCVKCMLLLVQNVCCTVLCCARHAINN